MLEWIERLPPAVYLQQSPTVYLLVNAAHIAALGVLVGAIFALDLRILGAARALPLGVVGPYLSRIASGGVVCALLTGLWLFSVRPAEYVSNAAFLAKVALVALGLVNALWLHRRRAWRLALKGDPASLSVRAQAVASIVCWFGAIVAGRWIGFL